MSGATNVAKGVPPRLRMFAGPNGSGKTTVKNGLQRPPEWFGIYVNPDEIEKSLRETGKLPVSPLGLTTDTDEVRAFFNSSKLLKNRGLRTEAIEFREGAIEFSGVLNNSYYASVAADFLRRKALEAERSFSFETVMSSPDKVELLRTAGGLDYRTYLYFVATEHPDINVARVAQRVADGGHDVPTDKIVARYYRSLALLPDAIRAVDRAFIFDSSESQSRYVAEVTEGTRLTLKTDVIPAWFHSTMAKL